MTERRIAHVISSNLGAGGAEMMLHALIKATRGAGLQHSVCALIGGGHVGSMLESEGVRVTSLGMRQGVPDPRAIGRLVRWLRQERPDVVQSWMYHADLLAGIAARLAGRIPVVWGVHHSDVDPRKAKRLTTWTRLLCARLSGILPARIVCVADSVLRSHVGVGYRPDRMTVIPNGFDLERFNPNPEAGTSLRRALAVPANVPVVGLLARYHPDKDHPNFLRAASLVARKRPDVVYLLAGSGVDWSNPDLAGLIGELGLRDRVRLLGVVSDVVPALSAMDVLALSSRTEAFPIVLGEAMACCVPCAATDCGDASQILGETGRIAPPGDPAGLARAILELLELSPGQRVDLGRAARERVRDRFEIGAVGRRYAEVYAEVTAGRRVDQGGPPR
jgi:glycosyltransferase involved in cell wall biosynthesis